MSIVYRIDPEIGITFVVYDGPVTGEEFEAHTRRLMADPGWPPDRKLHLTDMTSQIKPEQLRREVIEATAHLWGTLPNQLAGMKIAVVASEGFENARRFEAAVSKHGPTTVVFNLVSTACMWLGVDIETAERAIKALRSQAREGPQSQS